jgi:hypothetical protein
MEATQYRRFNGKINCLCLWPTYIGEKGRIREVFRQNIRDLNQGAIGNTFEEHIGNIRNTLRT